MKHIKLKKYILIFLLLLMNFNFVSANNNVKNDYIYSAAYFDNLIEMASMEHQEEIEKNKQEEKELAKKAQKDSKSGDIQVFDLENELKLADNVVEISDGNSEDIGIFKLRIQNSVEPPKYSETFKKLDTKVLIPVGRHFSFMQGTSTSRNKYSSTDYKILAGGEFQPHKKFKISGGLETNYRDIDQNPISRKLYIIPEIKLTEKLNIIFPNKYNISSGSTDHDIGLSVSPFDSKPFDFGVYSGITRTSQGKTTQSVNFSTNFYLF